MHIKQTRVAILIILFLGAFVVSEFNVNAASGGASMGGSTPFGGRVSMSMVCICNYSHGGSPSDIYIQVGSPKGGSFITTMTTRIYRNYAPFSGHWVLGLAESQNGQCWVGAYDPYCYQIGSGKKIKIIGTS